ncbi:MAG: putative toxin-antitoxin system toxin component, PIN family [Gemmatimonadota bacterium]|uniref:putative toxin-antitoxin system toxin component, PIN family n=1 Tax=Candidatus Palauibacter scopulicola TaxID=3056741 RepID=UPI002387D280|nr:putative toxin-antitoxin system toxin component, PIN family [Candidatus Palauibacter scopulicola]MDE2662552.1 putative toxin-antitoxin system toxin component, PIN family [Candidatus Palauibacter scopulicola]
MRIVLDTNVFVSGVFFGGHPGSILEAWRDGRVDVVVSREIIEEYVRVGQRLSSRFPGVDLTPALDLLGTSATLVEAPPLAEPICRDADGDKFIACAMPAAAKYVVSGDRDLLDVSPYRTVVVVPPRALIDFLA